MTEKINPVSDYLNVILA